MKKITFTKILCVAAAFALIFPFIPVAVGAETDAMVQSLNDQLAEYERKKAEIDETLRSLDIESGNIWDEISQYNELVNIDTQKKLAAQELAEFYTKQIEEKTKEIEETTARIEAQQDAFYDRMLDNYMEKETDYIELILGAESLVDFLTKVDYVSSILASDRKIISSLEEDKTKLEQAQAILEEAQVEETVNVAKYEESIRELQDLESSKMDALDRLENDKEQQRAYVMSIQNSEADLNASLEKRLADIAAEQERQRIAAEAARKAAEEAAAKAAEEAAAKKAAEEAAARAAEEAAAKAAAEAAAAAQQYNDGTGWEIPIQDQTEYDSYDYIDANGDHNGDSITEWTGEDYYSTDGGNSYVYNGTESSSTNSYYMQNYDTGEYVGGSVSWVLDPGASYYVSSNQGSRDIYGYYDYHYGMDFACAAGTSILAYNAGQVIISEWHNSYGNYVVVDHGGGITTTYAHMMERAVSVGQWVEAGQTLGYVGMTGSASGYHLHFEVRVAGAVQNPREWFPWELPAVGYRELN